MASILLSLLIAAQFLFGYGAHRVTSATATYYVAGLGDSVLRGDMLATCPANTHSLPCPQNFFDLATRQRGAIGDVYNLGIDGIDAGEPSPQAGIIGEEIPHYCNDRLPFDFTVIHTAGNDVHRWEGGYLGNVSLQQAFNTYYVAMVRDARSCHPETKLILMGVDDNAWRCDHSLSPTTAAHQARLNEYNGYIRQYASTLAGTRYMDTWGLHSNADGTGVPVYSSTHPWYYGPNWSGVVNGVQTGGNCVHPGLLGHQLIARSLVAMMWPM